MFPGMNQKKMKRVMRQLGMKMDDIPASEVTIKTDSGEIKIEEPQVLKTTMKGQVVFQISGKVKEEPYSEEDVKLVMEQSGIDDQEKIKQVLEETKGDVAEAIMKLKEE